MNGSDPAVPASAGTTGRLVAVLATPAPAAAAPPGVDPEKYRLALIEDTYDVVAGLELVTAALAVCPPDQPAVEELTWPGTPILRIADPPPGPLLGTVLAGLGTYDADQAAVVAGDAPDLPPLLLGKLFRALGHAEVAVCPAEGGGLVALAARLPLPGWLADVELDSPDAVEVLRRRAPSRRAFAVGPGWHRLRRPADLAHLDPGLEGWAVTRTLLGG